MGWDDSNRAHGMLEKRITYSKMQRPHRGVFIELTFCPLQDEKEDCFPKAPVFVKVPKDSTTIVWLLMATCNASSKLGDAQKGKPSRLPLCSTRLGAICSPLSSPLYHTLPAPIEHRLSGQIPLGFVELINLPVHPPLSRGVPHRSWKRAVDFRVTRPLLQHICPSKYRWITLLCPLVGRLSRVFSRNHPRASPTTRRLLRCFEGY